MSSAIRRLQKDYLEYQANREEFTLISAQPLEENLFEWHVNICAPDGPYANLPLHFIMDFPKNYPNAPPKVKLCTIIEHPNVFENWGDSGAWICLDLLKEYTTSTKYEGWSSVYTVTSILLQLQSFLFSENVPQDYGGNSSLEYGNGDVVTSLNRIKSFKCKCGHHWKKPSPALPKAFNQLICTKVSHSGSKLLAEEGAVINQDTVFWQEFPAWKKAAYDCGALCKTRGNRLMYECKIDWGWNGFYQEDIRIGWGVITCHNPLQYKVISESPADQGVHYWPSNLKVGDYLTTAIDMDRGRCWWAVNGKIVTKTGSLGYGAPAHKGLTGDNAGVIGKKTREYWMKNKENLVPIVRFRACRLKFNFGVPKFPVKPFLASGFYILEVPKAKEAPAADIATWKEDNETSADVFPPQVFQDIIEFLPMPDIINARSSCATVRSLIEEAAIIPRREVHCFKTKKSWGECVLGIGLTCEKNDRLTLEEVKPNMEFLSLEEWENGQRQSAWGEPLTDFLVLPVARKHFNLDLIVKYMQQFGAAYRLGGGHSASEILNVFSKLMNMCVVTMMKETQEGKCNEKLLTGYTQFHHLLLSLNNAFPEVAKLAQKKVNNFISSDAYRHKKDTPDLGKLLVMASLCPGMDFKKFERVLFVECSRRRVLWYLKDCPGLANISHSDEDYCQRVFELTEVSRGVIAFQIAFLKTLALPKEGQTLSDVLSTYYMRYGQPRTADMASLFKQAKAIVKCTTWKEHLEHCGLSLGGTELARILKASVDRSLKAGYHRASGSTRSGSLGQTRGNPAGKGLFRGSTVNASSLEHRALFYIPPSFYNKVKEVVSKISGAKLSLPPARMPRPVVVGAYTQGALSQAKTQLKAEFPYLSTKPLKTEYVGFEYALYMEHKQQIVKLADTYNVSATMPKEFTFPVAILRGSEKGISLFSAEVEKLIGSPLSIKTQDHKRFICPRCNLSFPGRDGALRPKDLVHQEAAIVCRFCWPVMRKEQKEKEESRQRRLREVQRQLEAQKREEAKLKLVEDLKNGELSEDHSFPLSFKLRRHAQVRIQQSLESEKVTVLLEKSWVEVSEVSGNRARITCPVEGWVTLVTAKGLLLDPASLMDSKDKSNLLARDVMPFRLIIKEQIKEELEAAKEKVKEESKKVVKEDAKEKVKKKVSQQQKLQNPPKKGNHVRKSSIGSDKSEVSQAASSDSGSTQTEPVRKVVKIGPKAAPIQNKKKPTGRPIIPGRSYKTSRGAIVRASCRRDSKYMTTLDEGALVYVEKVYPKIHRAKITSPVRGWISTWTKKGRLLQ